MWGIGWFGSIVMVAFWVLIFLSITYLVRTTVRRPEPSPRSPGSDPREILKERYARGEIKTQEFRKMMEILG